MPLRVAEKPGGVLTVVLEVLVAVVAGHQQRERGVAPGGLVGDPGSESQAERPGRARTRRLVRPGLDLCHSFGG